jgi:hypothetical protein
MKQCWNMKASERPTFESIPSYLSDIRNDIIDNNHSGKQEIPEKSKGGFKPSYA